MASSLPPGPRLPRIVQTVGWWNRPLAFLEQCRRRYGRRFTIRLVVNSPVVMLSDPDEIREMFTAPPDVLHPGEGTRILEPVVGHNSVLLLDEGAHLEQRKLLLPAFHGQKMQALSGVMREVADREVSSWTRDRPIVLHPRLQALTLEIILRAVFGLDEGGRLDTLRDRLKGILMLGALPLTMLPFAQHEIGGRTPWARFVRLRAEIDESLFELIEERRREDAPRDDVLSMLLAARHEDDGSPMSNQELRDELMTLLVAGHETTASELAWAFERLVREPAVMRRLSDEVRRGEDGEPYITATVQETLRRRPVLPNSAPRLVKKPIEIGGWRYDERCGLAANAYLVHHDPDIYPDPYAFRPERFIDEPPGTYTWIPFGGGRRRCLGASFAMQEMNIVLRSVFEQAELRPTSNAVELVRRRSITVSPSHGACAVVTDRDRTPAAPAAA